MTVSELLEKLAQVDPADEVVVFDMATSKITYVQEVSYLNGFCLIEPM